MNLISLKQAPTETILRWVTEGQVLRFAGTVPEAWLRILRDQGYTIQRIA